MYSEKREIGVKSTEAFQTFKSASSQDQDMTSLDQPSQKYDGTILAGTALALYWSLYVQPQNGEILALVIGCLPVAIGLYRYVTADQYLLQGLFGLIAVVLGGMSSASLLTGTQFGQWLTGGSPMPLSFSFALIVVLCVVLLRRVVTPATRKVDTTA